MNVLRVYRERERERGVYSGESTVQPFYLRMGFLFSGCYNIRS